MKKYLTLILLLITKVKGAVNDNIVAYWGLDDNAANTTYTDDYNTFDLACTDNTSVTYISGKVGGAFSVIGIDRRSNATITNSEEITGDTKLSVAWWYYFDAVPTTSTRIIFNNANGDYVNWQFYHHNITSRISCWGSDETSTFFADSVSGLDVGWNFIVFTVDFDADEMKIYVNSVDVTETGGSYYCDGVSMPAYAGSTLRLGWTQDISDPCAILDEIIVFKDVLSQDDVNTLYNNGDGIDFNEIITATLSLSSEEGGSVTAPGEGDFDYSIGTVVDINAESGEGYHFYEWTGDVSAVTDVCDGNTTVIMNDDYSIAATFEADALPPEPNVFITFFSSAGGSVTTPGEGVYEYEYDTLVNIIAEPEDNNHFVNWTGTAADAIKIQDIDFADTNVTADANYTVIANFTCDTYTLTVLSDGNGTAFPTDPCTACCGLVLDINADPDTGYEFNEWTGTAAGYYYVDTTGVTPDWTGKYVAYGTINGEPTYKIETGDEQYIFRGMSYWAIGPVPDSEVTWLGGTEIEGTYDAIEADGAAVVTYVDSMIADVNSASTTVTINANINAVANFAVSPTTSGFGRDRRFVHPAGFDRRRRF